MVHRRRPHARLVTKPKVPGFVWCFSVEPRRRALSVDHSTAAARSRVMPGCCARAMPRAAGKLQSIEAQAGAVPGERQTAALRCRGVAMNPWPLLAAAPFCSLSAAFIRPAGPGDESRAQRACPGAAGAMPRLTRGQVREWGPAWWSGTLLTDAGLPL